MHNLSEEWLQLRGKVKEVMSFDNSKPIRLIELFAGIGSQAKALSNLGLTYEHWRVCEFDEHAVRSYNAVHGTNFAPSDITKTSAADLGITDTSMFTYLLTYSFPCQDLSPSGKGSGMGRGSGTRSGLLWEVERLLNECGELPQVLLMENVPQVHGQKNIAHFDEWIAFLESKGYSNYWKDLNAKDFSIPQNRVRCYMVSILGDHKYDFPVPKTLTKTLGDLLDKDVGTRYYLTDERCHRIAKWNSQQNPLERVLGVESICPTLTARGAGEYHAGMVLFSPALKNTTNLRGEVLQREECDNDTAMRVLTPNECWRSGSLSSNISRKRAKRHQCKHKKQSEWSRKRICQYHAADVVVEIGIMFFH